MFNCPVYRYSTKRKNDFEFYVPMFVCEEDDPKKWILKNIALVVNTE